MTDMPSDFWGGYILVVTVVSLLGLAWLVWSVYFSANGHHEGEEPPVWDETLREGANPAPMWWFWMILIMMVFSVLYLMLYPGLGSFSGMLKWSQGGRLQQSVEAYEAEFGGLRQLVNDAQIGTLQSQPDYMRSAKRIYDRNCAVCHGYDAAGQASLFPNLTDGIWQWGGSPEQVEQTLRNGRQAVMVGWQQALGDDGVRNVADYVLQLASGPREGIPGQAQYNQFCVACHGIDGAGNPALGAPSLIDDVWLYGNSEAAVRESIATGRNGQMPAFGERLDDTQIRLLVAWLTR